MGWTQGVCVAQFKRGYYGSFFTNKFIDTAYPDTIIQDVRNHLNYYNHTTLPFSCHPRERLYCRSKLKSDILICLV